MSTKQQSSIIFIKEDKNNMSTLCGADCSGCSFKAECRGCAATCGIPFGGKCVAAEYIKNNGRDRYAEYKADLLSRVNDFMRNNGLPEATALFELTGFLVNMAYELPNGESVRFLDDRNVYLGTQMEYGDRFLGVISDGSFILVCSYGMNGSDPELTAYGHLKG